MVDLEVSAITDEFSLEFDEVCEYLQQKEVKYIELRKVWIGNVVEIDDRTVKDSKDIIDECGLKVSSIASPLLKVLPPSVNPEPKETSNYSTNWKYNFSLIDRAIEVAEIYDAPYIRCFGFRGKWDVKDVDEWDDWQIYQEWQDALNEMKQKAAAKGKTLICENEGGINQGLDQMLRIGKDNCGSGFGLLYDTANVANKFGKFGILTDEWLRKLGKYIQYFHAKGCKMTESGTQTAIVNEDEDFCRWPQIVDYFKDMDKEEFVEPSPDPLFMSIETHMGDENMWDKSAKSLENLMDLVYN